MTWLPLPAARAGANRLTAKIPCLAGRLLLAQGLALCLLGASGCPSALTGGTSTSSERQANSSGAALAATGSSASLPAGSPRHRTATLPGGLPCLIRLQEEQIPFQSLATLPGVHTPVRITGPIGGVRYRPLGRTSLRCDCRLALALARAAPLLRQLGVEEVLFSSAYSYRRRQDGRLSQHAMGLALDVHRLAINGRRYEVAKDYVTGQSCQPGLPALNQLACLLKAHGVFDWVLTPDTDSAHADHLHLDLYCLYRRRFVAQGTPPLANQD